MSSLSGERIAELRMSLVNHLVLSGPEERDLLCALEEVEACRNGSCQRTAMDDCSVCHEPLDVIGVFRKRDGRGGMRHSRKVDCK